MVEIWKDIKDYEGFYMVSSLGNVKSLKRKRVPRDKTLVACVCGVGYFVVGLSKKGVHKTKAIHQLVAIAFLNHTPNGKKIVVDHIDNDKLNNSLENLQLITHRHNLSKDKKKYSSQHIGVSWSKKRKSWRSSIGVNGVLQNLGNFTDETQAAEAYQLALNNIEKE